MNEEEFILGLKEWDKKNTALLRTLFEENFKYEKFPELLVQLLENYSEVEQSVSWLIKHSLEQAVIFKENLLIQSLLYLSKAKHWQTKLHLLQIIPHHQFDIDTQNSLLALVHHSLTAENTFVRAAAYEAYGHLLMNRPRNEVLDFRQHCEHQLETEKASVRVKLKRLLKKLPK